MTVGFINNSDRYLANAMIATNTTGIVATGGTESTVTSGALTYKVHTFTSTGNTAFVVSSTGSLGYNTLEILCVGAGGGAGGNDGPNGAGGGSGAIIVGNVSATVSTYYASVGGTGGGGTGCCCGGCNGSAGANFGAAGGAAGSSCCSGGGGGSGGLSGVFITSVSLGTALIVAGGGAGGGGSNEGPANDNPACGGNVQGIGNTGTLDGQAGFGYGGGDGGGYGAGGGGWFGGNGQNGGNTSGGGSNVASSVSLVYSANGTNGSQSGTALAPTYSWTGYAGTGYGNGATAGSQSSGQNGIVVIRYLLVP